MTPRAQARTVVMAHHTPDVYGSDRQLLESVSALTGVGIPVVVTLPHDGPLVPLVKDRGATVTFIDIPVLRKKYLSPPGIARLILASLRALRPAIRLLQEHNACVLYVNTLTIPLWLVAGRLAKIPSLCHVHEALNEGPRLLRAGLVAPLLMAARVVTNSAASQEAIQTALPRAAARSTVVHNGISGPPNDPSPPALDRSPIVLVQVGRLSPIKGQETSLDAVADLVRRGHDVNLHLVGGVFEGYEWYETRLRIRASQEDLVDHVRFLGYQAPTWPALADASMVLVPSQTEGFGNTAVEAMLARRPVVASNVEGLKEIVVEGETGVLVTPGDAGALAAGIEGLLQNPSAAIAMGNAGRERASRLFTPERYAAAILAEVNALAG